MPVKFIYDMHDREVIGPNPTLAEEQPARFRYATQAEIDAHHKKYGPPLGRPAPVKEVAVHPDVMDVPDTKPIVLDVPAEVALKPPAKKPLSPAQQAHIEKMNAARLAKKAVKEQVSA